MGSQLGRAGQCAMAALAECIKEALLAAKFPAGKENLIPYSAEFELDPGQVGRHVCNPLTPFGCPLCRDFVDFPPMQVTPAVLRFFKVLCGGTNGNLDIPAQDPQFSLCDTKTRDCETHIFSMLAAPKPRAAVTQGVYAYSKHKAYVDSTQRVKWLTAHVVRLRTLLHHASESCWPGYFDFAL